jgi:hypothetical protein
MVSLCFAGDLHRRLNRLRRGNINRPNSSLTEW